jgi:alpha-1,3-rhamnosyl/mannosyltransferase
VASNNSSLKELFGQCSYPVEPHSVESIAAGIDRVISDEALRNELKARGKARAADFSWEKTADQTLEVYCSLTDKRL